MIYDETAMPKEPTKQVLFSAARGALCFEIQAVRRGKWLESGSEAPAPARMDPENGLLMTWKPAEYIGGCLFFSTS